MVGVSLPYSIASRRAKGQSFGRMLLHSVWRALVLVALGIFLRSQSRSQTYFTFEDVLTQIGLGYVFLFLLAWTRPRTQLTAAALILVGYWASVRALSPAGAGVRHENGWRAASRLAAPRDRLRRALGQEYERCRAGRPVVPEPLPARAAVRLQRRRLPDAEFRALAGDDDLRAAGGRRSARRAAGARQAARSRHAGALPASPLDSSSTLLGICPIVKRIWTPSWTLFSGGWVVLFLAAYYYALDLAGYTWARRLAFPFLVDRCQLDRDVRARPCRDRLLTRSLVIHFGTRTVRGSWRGLRPGAPRRLHARASSGSSCCGCTATACSSASDSRRRRLD